LIENLCVLLNGKGGSNVAFLVKQLTNMKMMMIKDRCKFLPAYVLLVLCSSMVSFCSLVYSVR